MPNCIYQMEQESNPEIIFCTLDLKFNKTPDCETCKDRIPERIVINSHDNCIHKYEKSIGDEGFSFCDIEERCVEGDICKYCIAYEEGEDG